MLTPNRRLAITRVSAAAPSNPGRRPRRPAPFPDATPSKYAAAFGAERHADADVVRALRHEVRHHAVDADDSQSIANAANAPSIIIENRCRASEPLIRSDIVRTSKTVIVGSSS